MPLYNCVNVSYAVANEEDIIAYGSVQARHEGSVWFELADVEKYAIHVVKIR
ncbi:hypothetical protein Dimus_018897 [Dionaea muscipula]